jgi:hypothetical protein
MWFIEEIVKLVEEGHHVVISMPNSVIADRQLAASMLVLSM